MAEQRMPAVAGRFYPAAQADLLAEVGAHLRAETRERRERAIGCVAPHAGYMYSGHVAGAVFAALELPRRFIILCPNHTGRGRPLAIMSKGTWRTPLGDATIDEQLAMALRKDFSALEEDAEAHRQEHSLEVELPFLQAEVSHFTFVPICIGTGWLDLLLALGDSLARLVREQQESVLLIASSDMNHYEPDARTRAKDAMAIDQIIALDPVALHEVVHRERISMCGYAPTVTVLQASRSLGATSAELVKYATSADVSGDRSAVVGYAGLIIK